MKKHISKICGHKITCANKERIKVYVDAHHEACPVVQKKKERYK